MRVRMRVPTRISDAGRERPLDLGVVYDLPTLVAESLVSLGMALPVPDDPVVVSPLPPVAVREIRPLYPPEHGRQRRREGRQ